MIPTRPELRTNYFERTWSRKHLRELRRAGEECDFEEEESDPDKKEFAIE